MDPPRQRGRDYRGLALASTAVGEMVVPILIGVWADSGLGSSPAGLIVGAVVGVVGGFAHLVYVSRGRAGGPGR